MAADLFFRRYGRYASFSLPPFLGILTLGEPAATWKGHSDELGRGHLGKPTNSLMDKQAWKRLVQPQVSLDNLTAPL